MVDMTPLYVILHLGRDDDDGEVEWRDSLLFLEARMVSSFNFVVGSFMIVVGWS